MMQPDQLPPQAPPPYSTTPIEAQVKAPAISIVVLAILNLFSQLIAMAVSMIDPQSWYDRDMLESLGVPPDIIAAIEEGLLVEPDAITMAFDMGSNFILAVAMGFMLIGALKMLRLESYGLALTAAILAILPCTYCCCPGVLFGIWALAVLLKPEVKYAFHQKAHA